MRITSNFLAVALLVPADGFVPQHIGRKTPLNLRLLARALKPDNDLRTERTMNTDDGKTLKFDNTLETSNAIKSDGALRSFVPSEIDVIARSNQNIMVVDGSVPTVASDWDGDQLSTATSPLYGTLLSCTVIIIFLIITLLQSNNINDSFLEMGIVEKISLLSHYIPDQFDKCEVYVAVILGFAAFTQALVGFAFAVVAVGALSSLPWLLHSEVYEVVTPVVATMGTLVGTILILPNAKNLEWDEILPLTIPCAIFTPVGIYLSSVVDTAVATKALAVLVLGFVAYNIFKGDSKPPKALSSTPAAFLLGAGAGIFGGLFDIQGPPLVVYGNAKEWKPRQFRDNILAVVSLTSALVVVIDYFNGTLLDFHYADFCLVSIPLSLVGIAVGEKVVDIIDPQLFKNIVLGMCTILGVRLLTLS